MTNAAAEGPVLRRAPTRSSALLFVLKFLIISEQGAPNFHISLGPESYIGSPAGWH